MPTRFSVRAVARACGLPANVLESMRQRGYLSLISTTVNGRLTVDRAGAEWLATFAAAMALHVRPAAALQMAERGAGQGALAAVDGHVTAFRTKADALALCGDMPGLLLLDLATIRRRLSDALEAKP